ncbi:MAG: hypothetical protein D6744_15890, partial [Planctomycetota bacterium]
GSGCIAVALAVHLPDAQIAASDISDAAIARLPDEVAKSLALLRVGLLVVARVERDSRAVHRAGEEDFGA